MALKEGLPSPIGTAIAHSLQRSLENGRNDSTHRKAAVELMKIANPPYASRGRNSKVNRLYRIRLVKRR